MKHILTTLTMLLCLHCGAQQISSPRSSAEADRQGAALLMVHFGTTIDKTRTNTIDAINDKARQAFPQMKVVEAYTSRTVMKRLAGKAILKDTPTDALLRLRADGYRSISVQPTFIIDGREMDQLRREVEQLRPFFDTISIGSPLLYSIEDCQQVCNVLADRHPANAKKHEHVLFVGHGTKGPATALYSQLDYMLHANGHPNHHVATIEGYPTLQTVTARLKALQAKKVTLVPLLFVAGDHATIDIDVEWKEALESEGFIVNTVIEGLGEVPEIQQLYLEKIMN
jgi:sirohydrochlorin cobaltochelatase